MKPPADIQPRLLWTRTAWAASDTPTVTADGLTVYQGAGYRMEGFENPDAHEKICRVYWGSHGCDRPHGHDGDHWCDCCDCADHPDPDSGCVAGPPYYGTETTFYGEDVPGWENPVGTFEAFGEDDG